MQTHSDAPLHKSLLLTVSFVLILCAGPSVAQNPEEHGTVVRSEGQDSLVVQLDGGVIPKVRSVGYVLGQGRPPRIATVRVEQVEDTTLGKRNHARVSVQENPYDSTLVDQPVEFQKLKALLRIVIENSDKATVKVDGTKFSTQEGDTVTVKLEPGTHKVRVSGQGYEPRTKELKLERGDRKELEVPLSP